MGKIFGTDGARGLVNKELSGDLALNLGKCMVHVLREEKKKEDKRKKKKENKK